MNARVSRTTLTEKVADAIVTLIEEGGLREGDALPATGEMAQLFGVSLPVVREAVAGLSGLGLLHRHQGREAVVSAPSSAHLERLLRHRIQSADVSNADIQDYRELVEIGIARLAGEHATDENIAALEEALGHLRAATTEVELRDADVQFHAEVARASGNDLLILTLAAIAPLLRRQRLRVWRGWVAAGGEREPIVEAHAVILEHIKRHDAAGAADAMRTHLSQPRLGLEADLPEYLSDESGHALRDVGEEDDPVGG